MEPKVFAEIEDVNRLHLSHYWLKSTGEIKPFEQILLDELVFSGDCGEPEHYRAELFFKQVLYLDCPFQLFSAVHWRMARPEEGQRVFPAETMVGFMLQDARRKSQVYCLEVGPVASDQTRLAARNKEEATQFSQDHPSHRTFFIVAIQVKIVVQYAGNDLETYLEHLQQRALPDHRERS